MHSNVVVSALHTTALKLARALLVKVFREAPSSSISKLVWKDPSPKLGFNVGAEAVGESVGVADLLEQAGSHEMGQFEIKWASSTPH